MDDDLTTNSNAPNEENQQQPPQKPTPDDLLLERRREYCEPLVLEERERTTKMFVVTKKHLLLTTIIVFLMTLLAAALDIGLSTEFHYNQHATADYSGVQRQTTTDKAEKPIFSTAKPITTSSKESFYFYHPMISFFPLAQRIKNSTTAAAALTLAIGKNRQLLPILNGISVRNTVADKEITITTREMKLWTSAFSKCLGRGGGPCVFTNPGYCNEMDPCSDFRAKRIRIDVNTTNIYCYNRASVPGYRHLIEICFDKNFWLFSGRIRNMSFERDEFMALYYLCKSIVSSQS